LPEYATVKKLSTRKISGYQCMQSSYLVLSAETTHPFLPAMAAKAVLEITHLFFRFA
jgi:hypothetical protein